MIFSACASESEPPNTVKSWLNTQTSRPSILPGPGDHAVPQVPLLVEAEIGSIGARPACPSRRTSPHPAGSPAAPGRSASPSCAVPRSAAVRRRGAPVREGHFQVFSVSASCSSGYDVGCGECLRPGGTPAGFAARAAASVSCFPVNLPDDTADHKDQGRIIDPEQEDEEERVAP